jgi:hypothetical protein
MTRAEEFRQNADDCRQQAERARNPLDKERWLKIAEHWLLMAHGRTSPITRNLGRLSAACFAFLAGPRTAPWPRDGRYRS